MNVPPQASSENSCNLSQRMLHKPSGKCVALIQGLNWIVGVRGQGSIVGHSQLLKSGLEKAGELNFSGLWCGWLGAW